MVNTAKNYKYDGSFDGLLTAIYFIYYSHSVPNTISCDTPEFYIPITGRDSLLFKDNNKTQINFFNETSGKYIDNFNHLPEETLIVSTDNVKSQKVYEAIASKIGEEALDNIYYTYISGVSGKEIAIYEYLRIGFKIGSNINLHLYDDSVLKILKIVKKVNNEIQDLVGFIRFTCINNIYYSAYEPDHNITEFMAPHFAERLPDQFWIIHDKRRNIAAIYDKKNWLITDFTETDFEELTDLLNNRSTSSLSVIRGNDSSYYEELWKEYFKSTTIKERLKRRQQKSSMPKRYWKHMLETEEK